MPASGGRPNGGELTAQRVVAALQAAAVQARHGRRLQQHHAHVGRGQRLAQPVVRRRRGLRHRLGPVQVQHAARRRQPQQPQQQRLRALGRRRVARAQQQHEAPRRPRGPRRLRRLPARARRLLRRLAQPAGGATLGGREGAELTQSETRRGALLPLAKSILYAFRFPY